MGFGLMTRFIGLFETPLMLHFRIHYYTYTHTLVSTVTSSLQLPMANVPLPLVSCTIPGLSYQLLTATAHND
jgi:hypothetical protein